MSTRIMTSNILRIALGDLLRAIADRIAMTLEHIPHWEELGDLPAFYDLSGTNSEYDSDGSTSRSAFGHALTLLLVMHQLQDLVLAHMS
jgi:hypothetical protein